MCPFCENPVCPDPVWKPVRDDSRRGARSTTIAALSVRGKTTDDAMPHAML